MLKNISGVDVTEWDTIIIPRKSYLRLNIKDVWQYRDLLQMFIKRDIVTVYKQTVLGPIWFFLQPILTTIVFTCVFGNMAHLSTDGLPQILFYLSSVTLWSYFSDTLNITSKTFSDNANIFGKVYFPRIILPLSKVFSGLIKFAIQFALFLAVWVYYTFISKGIHPNLWILSFPLVLLVMVCLGLGSGILITSLTTKYRDLTFLITFGVQLLMYATPVIYPASSISSKYKTIIWLNPLTSLFELFKYGFLGKGEVQFGWLAYSVAFTFVLLLIGIISFNKVEQRFIDTV